MRQTYWFATRCNGCLVIRVVMPCYLTCILKGLFGSQLFEKPPAKLVGFDFFLGLLLNQSRGGVWLHSASTSSVTGPILPSTYFNTQHLSKPASVLNINKKCPALIYSSSLCSHGLLYSCNSSSLYSRHF